MTAPVDSAKPPRRAAFLDRDGTLIRDANFLRDPEDVVLLSGVPAALTRLAKAGYALVVITNQSGIARGLLTESDYDAVRRRLDALLAERGVTLTESYHCPHHPDITGDCECRKPGTLLHRRAAEEHGLELAQSVFIGDRWRDVAPAIAFGGHGILIPTAESPEPEIAQAKAEATVARDLEHAVALVVGAHQG